MSSIFKSTFSISNIVREKQKNQQGVVIWFTGLSAAGKTTIANEVDQLLIDNNNHTYILDGDIIRNGLSSDLQFDQLSRKENLRRIRHISEMFCDAGIVTLVTVISPFQADREKARLLLKGKYIEVYVKVSLEVAESRDPKGLYKKARAGQLENFTGIDSPYEPPEYAEIVLDTEKFNASECALKVFTYLRHLKFVN